MSEYQSSPEHQEPPLDREAIVTHLQEIGIDVEIEDWEGDDDNDILGNIAGLAAEYDLDMTALYAALGIPIEDTDSLE
jgi:hypothetical protein